MLGLLIGTEQTLDAASRDLPSGRRRWPLWLPMNQDELRKEIVGLEAQIDELADTIESCRKFILAGWIAAVGGSIGLIAILVDAIRFDLSLMTIAMAAILGGIVVAGSNRSTAKEATRELTAAEAKRTALIGQLDSRLVSGRDGRQ
jgi:hypothetical protein